MKLRMLLVAIGVVLSCNYYTHAMAANFVDKCASTEVSVYVTYPIIDTIGPGFGSQSIDHKRQLGTVVRQGCYSVDAHKITAWRYQGPYGIHPHYGADEEELPEILSASYQIDSEQDKIIVTQDVVYLPEEGSVATAAITLYRDPTESTKKKKKKEETAYANK